MELYKRSDGTEQLCSFLYAVMKIFIHITTVY